MLRNSGSTPIPSGSMRINSSSPPGRRVGLMQPRRPRQLVNAMMLPPLKRFVARAIASLRRMFKNGLDALDDRRRRFIEFLDQGLNLGPAGELEIDLPLLGVGLK